MQKDYGRTTISVPMALKGRMKKARARVNWSAVACDAFEQKLSEIGSIEEITSIDAAFERMKGLKAAGATQENPPSGEAAGTRWAMNYSRPSQLERMEAFRNGMSQVKWEQLLTSPQGSEELAHCLVPSATQSSATPEPEGRTPGKHRRRPRLGNGHRGSDSHNDVWTSILGQTPDDPKFFLGFANGALEVWRHIKDRL